MISIDGANAYFSNHSRRADWEGFSLEQRKAALSQALRDVSRALGRPLREDEPTYRHGDRRRDEFAAYEQALYALVRDAPAEGELQSPVPSLNPDEAAGARRTLSAGRGKWSAEALAWLGCRQVVEAVMS